MIWTQPSGPLCLWQCFNLQFEVSLIFVSFQKRIQYQVGRLETGFGPYIIYKRYGPSETLLDLPGSSNTHFFLPNSIWWKQQFNIVLQTLPSHSWIDQRSPLCPHSSAGKQDKLVKDSNIPVLAKLSLAGQQKTIIWPNRSLSKILIQKHLL